MTTSQKYITGAVALVILIGVLAVPRTQISMWHLYSEVILDSDVAFTSCNELASKELVNRILLENKTIFDQIRAVAPGGVDILSGDGGLNCNDRAYIEIMVGTVSQRRAVKKILKESSISVPYRVVNI